MTTSSDRKIPYDLDYNWEHPWPRAPLPPNETERMVDLTRYAIIDTPMEDSYDKLCDIACQTMRCPIAAISFIDGERQWFKAKKGLTQSAIPRDVAFCAHALMTPSTPLVVLDTKKDERFKNNPLVTRASTIRFYASVPLCSTNGHAIGSIFVFDTKAHETCELNKMVQIAMTLRQILEKRVRYLEKAKVDKQAERDAEAGKTSTSAPGRKVPSRAKAPAPPSASAPARGGGVMVPMNKQQPAQSTALAAPGQGGGQLGNMLMNLLARTTETQQQLATQQGMMFDTLGQHSQQISQLSEKLAMMEARMVDLPEK